MPQEAAEEIKQALVEGKDEEMIRIPPQPSQSRCDACGVLIGVVGGLIQCSCCQGSHCRQCCPAGLSVHIEHLPKPVFCGTTGDKEHIQERAMRPPWRLSILDAALQCARCSRLKECTESDAREHSPGWVCSGCLWLDKSERLADARGDPGRLLDCVAKPPTSA